MNSKKKKEIPNPSGQAVKEGDQVKIETGEFAGYVGEVVSFISKGKNWIKLVKIINKDNKIEFVEVTNVVVSFVGLLEDIGKSNVFKKLWSWLKKIFKKKNKAPK